MNEFVIIFRLPLNQDSQVVRILKNAGWERVTDAIYTIVREGEREELVSEVKQICQEARAVRLDYQTSAFTVIPLTHPRPVAVARAQ